MAVHLAVAGDVFDGVLFLCCPFFNQLSWVTSMTKNSPTYTSMAVYQIFRNCQCLYDLRVWTYDIGTLTTWLLYVNAIILVPCEKNNNCRNLPVRAQTAFFTV